MTAAQIPRAAHVLGWLGVLPFAAFALAAAAGSVLVPASAAQALVLYGAIILSFMGGAQWGLAVAPAAGATHSMWSRLSISVLPALSGFGFSFLPPAPALLGLAAAFAALLAYDVATARQGIAPSWYPALRLQLTIAVVVCLVAPILTGLR